ncbi:MAG: thiamine diphosphokinase [Chloroflexi bacterium]|nr:thiamine diphosphokinase [Chloroflexota bacterium]
MPAIPTPSTYPVMRAVVVAHGDVDPDDLAHVRAADLIVAADGGTETLARWGIEPHLVVGDLDSLGAERRARLDPKIVERWPAEKDKTDTELALERAVARGATEIVLLGALGGSRGDHAIANILALGLDRGSAVPIRLVRGPLSMRVTRGGGTATLDGDPGGVVTLLALGGEASGITTDGLRYPLAGGTLLLGSSRGVSNEIARKGATVRVGSGLLLIVEGGTPEPQAKA